jgi:hypothetical protein
MQEQAAQLPEMVERRPSIGSAACTPLPEGGAGGRHHTLLQIPDMTAHGAMEEAQRGLQTPGNEVLNMRSPQLQAGAMDGASGSGAPHQRSSTVFGGQHPHQVSEDEGALH